MKFIIIATLLMTLSTSYAAVRPTKFTSCYEDTYQDLKCSIDSVTIDGCQRGTGGYCEVKKNRYAGINIDFTPDFDGDDIKLLGYVVFPGVENEKNIEIDENACNYMKCPVASGVRHSYSFGMTLNDTLPPAPGLNLKYRFVIKKADQPKCCFFTRIKVIR